MPVDSKPIEHALLNILSDKYPQFRFEMNEKDYVVGRQILIRFELLVFDGLIELCRIEATEIKNVKKKFETLMNKSSEL